MGILPDYHEGMLTQNTKSMFKKNVSFISEYKHIDFKNQVFANLLNSKVCSGLAEPLEMTTVKSDGNTKGTRSLLKPYFVLKCPRKCPKSI